MDEASRCDDLMLLRDGRRLAHDTVAAILERTHTSDVESAFLALVEQAP
jgi:ABC-2 type transport system ATP-binding protein